MIENPPICPHCKKETQKYDVPPWDGVGWGVPFLYVCFNDECPLFVRGMGHMAENYGQIASYRYMVYPDTGQSALMAAVNPSLMERRINELNAGPEPEDFEE